LLRAVTGTSFFTTGDVELLGVFSLTGGLGESGNLIKGRNESLFLDAGDRDLADEKDQEKVRMKGGMGIAKEEQARLRVVRMSYGQFRCGRIWTRSGIRTRRVVLGDDGFVKLFEPREVEAIKDEMVGFRAALNRGQKAIEEIRETGIDWVGDCDDHAVDFIRNLVGHDCFARVLAKELAQDFVCVVDFG